MLPNRVEYNKTGLDEQSKQSEEKASRKNSKTLDIINKILLYLVNLMKEQKNQLQHYITERIGKSYPKS